MAKLNFRSLFPLLALLLTCVHLVQSSFFTNSIELRRRKLADKAALRAFERCPSLRGEGASLPLIQVKKRSSNRFLCNGILVSNQMILTTANCIDEITNPSKYVVGLKSPFENNSTQSSWMTISWACKQPGFEPTKSAHHNVGLIVLDRPVETQHYECLLKPHKIGQQALVAANSIQHHHQQQQQHSLAQTVHSAADQDELHIMRIHKEEPTINKLRTHGKGSLACRDNELSRSSAAHVPTGPNVRRPRSRQASLCHIQVDAQQLLESSGGGGGGSGPCNLEGAFVLVSQRREGSHTRSRMVASDKQSSPAPSSTLGLVQIAQELLDGNGCLKSGLNLSAFELRMLNLSKMWIDGQLKRLINHCSMSRR